MSLRAMLTTLAESLRSTPPEPVVYYGPHNVIWPIAASHPSGWPGSCWVCAWCGHNKSEDTWTDSDAYAAAVMHTRQHPDLDLKVVRETGPEPLEGDGYGVYR